MNKLYWFTSFGKVVEITENDEGYDWNRDGEIQLAWYPPRPKE